MMLFRFPIPTRGGGGDEGESKPLDKSGPFLKSDCRNVGKALRKRRVFDKATGVLLNVKRREVLSMVNERHSCCVDPPYKYLIRSPISRNLIRLPCSV